MLESPLNKETKITMDSKRKSRDIPFSNPFYQACREPLYFKNGPQPPKEKNVWWDNALGEWKIFPDDKSADMFRYAASRVKVPFEDIETLIARFPKKEWSVADCNYIVANWWRKEDPMADMISRFSIWAEPLKKRAQPTEHPEEILERALG